MKKIVTCRICNNEYISSPSFVSHIKIKHKIKKEEYIQKFPENEKDFDYQIKLTEKTKKIMSNVRKKWWAELDEEKSKKLKSDYQKRGTANWVKKITNVSKEEQKELLKKFQQSGTIAAAIKNKNRTKEEIKEIWDKQTKTKNQTIWEDKECICDECGKKSIKRLHPDDYKRRKWIFCDINCYKLWFDKNWIKIWTTTKNLGLDGNYYRSKYEVVFVNFLFFREDIKRTYESIRIQYFDNTLKKWRKYTPDFLIEYKNKYFLIEVGSKKLKENSQEWKDKKFYLEQYCVDNNLIFLFLNEDFGINPKHDSKKYWVEFDEIKFMEFLSANTKN